jgi:hypothetical protein
MNRHHREAIPGSADAPQFFSAFGTIRDEPSDTNGVDVEEEEIRLALCNP